MRAVGDLAEQPGPAQIGSDHTGDVGGGIGGGAVARDETGDRKGQGFDHTFGDFQTKRPVLGAHQPGQGRGRSQRRGGTDQGATGQHGCTSGHWGRV